ncbi:hypothetical protein K1719_023620 [Acacia pycnantha]|nr:hypothetical protein K1719_025597 [Acacia pycnantha]KAI9102110.1 hypothetical protein K1719_023620 [Acacia pycnantha]
MSEEVEELERAGNPRFWWYRYHLAVLSCCRERHVTLFTHLTFRRHLLLLFNDIYLLKYEAKKASLLA